jgi:hyperosmotically inducible protein
MMRKFTVTCLAVSVLLGSGIAIAAADSDTDRSHPIVFVKDSAITTKIKTKLAVDHPTTLALVHVDTDKDGVVWLTGTATHEQPGPYSRRHGQGWCRGTQWQREIAKSC